MKTAGFALIVLIAIMMGWYAPVSADDVRFWIIIMPASLLLGFVGVSIILRTLK